METDKISSEVELNQESTSKNDVDDIQPASKRKYEKKVKPRKNKVINVNNSPKPGVYMIYSKWSLHQIDNFISDYGKIGILRIVYDNNNNETDRTMVILEDTVYYELLRNGYGENRAEKGFKIVPFSVKGVNLPPNGHDKNLFIPVPKSLQNDDVSVLNVITDKLKHLAEWDIIPDKSWNLNIPVKSRELGGILDGCFIIFNPTVTIDQIAMTRLLLTDNFWPNQNEPENRLPLKCKWARSRESNSHSPKITTSVNRKTSEFNRSNQNDRQVSPKSPFPKKPTDHFNPSKDKVRSQKSQKSEVPSPKISAEKPNTSKKTKPQWITKEEKLEKEDEKIEKIEKNIETLSIPMIDQPSELEDL